MVLVKLVLVFNWCSMFLVCLWWVVSCLGLVFFGMWIRIWVMFSF